MNLERRIRKINQRLGEALGFIAGEPRYAWKESRNLFYFIQDGVYTDEPAPGNLIVLANRPRYKRECWADRLGANLWVLAQWDKPRMSPAAMDTRRADLTPATYEYWLANMGTEFPYPAKGQYYAISGTELDPGQEPSIDETDMLIDHIRKLESTSLRESIAQKQAEEDKKNEDIKAAFSDEVDSMWPAFDNAASISKLGQSRGGSVSFGGI